jgi:hypothetical protein
MNNEKETPTEGFSVDDKEMYYIIVATRALRLMSNKKSRKALIAFLEKEEIIWDGDGKWDDKIQWNKPSLDVFRKIENKFTKRMERVGLKITPNKA